MARQTDGCVGNRSFRQAIRSPMARQIHPNQLAPRTQRLHRQHPRQRRAGVAVTNLVKMRRQINVCND